MSLLSCALAASEADLPCLPMSRSTKGLGPAWAANHTNSDKLYCGLNGWLKPEIATLVHNFKALQAKGEELCKTKYAKYVESATLTDVLGTMLGQLGGLKHEKSVERKLRELDYRANKTDIERVV